MHKLLLRQIHQIHMLLGIRRFSATPQRTRTNRKKQQDVKCDKLLVSSVRSMQTIIDQGTPGDVLHSACMCHEHPWLLLLEQVRSMWLLWLEAQLSIKLCICKKKLQKNENCCNTEKTTRRYMASTYPTAMPTDVDPFKLCVKTFNV